MITPADMARMMSRADEAAASHAQNASESSVLLYTSQSAPRGSAPGRDASPPASSPEASSPSASSASSETPETPEASREPASDGAAHVRPSEGPSDASGPADAPQATRPVRPTPATVFARVRMASSETTANGQRITTRVEASVTASIEPAPEGVSMAAADAAGTAGTLSVSDLVADLVPGLDVSGIPVPDIPLPDLPMPDPIVLPTEPTPAALEIPSRPHARGSAKAPTPAVMPRRRTSDGPTTFASLDAQELPVVREYSAGGLVFDEHGRVAIIARHSRSGHLEWCLPKGHIEKGETPQQTAVREVHEETGILGEVVDSIATIDYWFTGTTQRVHKLVHHYALRQVGGELTVEGDPDHEAEDAIWVNFRDLDDVLSYPNERKIAWLYARKLNRQADE